VIGFTCYVLGLGEGLVDARCEENPNGGMRKYSYLVKFGKGEHTFNKWVESSKMTITGAALQAPARRSSSPETE